MHHTDTLTNECTDLLDEVKIVKRTLLKANHLFAGLFASRDRIGAFLAQFLCSDCNFLAGEVIQRQVRDNFPLAVVGGHRETVDQPFGRAVFPFRYNRHTQPQTLKKSKRCRRQQGKSEKQNLVTSADP